MRVKISTMKIKQNIKKHKLIERSVVEKTIFLVGDTKTDNVNITCSVVSLLAEYLIDGDFRYDELRVKSDNFIHALLVNSNSLVSHEPPVFVSNKGWRVGYLLGIGYYVDSNTGVRNIMEVYNGDKLIGKIKWERIR